MLAHEQTDSDFDLSEFSSLPDLTSWDDFEWPIHELPRVPVVAAVVPGARPYETSLKVFRRHLAVSKSPLGTVTVNAEGVISRACYEDWLATRSRCACEPEKTFQRILTCCVSGTDGRQPFSAEEEAGVLEQIRLKRVWPAFADTNFAIGSKGFRSFGHHEKARMQGELVSPPPTSTSTTKSPKRVKFAEPLSSSSSPSSPPSSKTASPNPSFTAADGELDFASCFNLFAASSNGSALLPQPSSRPPQTRDSASIAAELHAALSAFEARLPGWAVAGVDLWEPATVRALPSSHTSTDDDGLPVLKTSSALFGNWAAAGGVLGAVPDSQQLLVLKHVAHCVHVAPGVDGEFPCALKCKSGEEVAVRMVMHCYSGKLLVAARVLASAAS